ncbi:MAG TPA: nucleotide exchange factor GrpE [Schlesneria sp.]
MNDSTLQQESNGTPICRDVPPGDDSPQFGALDIVEAFTAMRHELRGQTKESRALAELIQGAAANIQSLESKLRHCVTDTPVDDDSSGNATAAKPLVLSIIETDHQLSRAAAAIAQWEANCKLRAEAETKAVERYFAGMNPLARWWARPLLTFITEQRSVPDSSAQSPAITGLDLVLAKLRRMMNEHDIERLDVVGQPFDANIMYAIGTIETADYSPGHVAEQLSPAYRWRGGLLRFADVRLAK